MSFYNTGNPVPSIDPRDLDDNAKHVDELVNSTLPTFVDRLGTERRTLAGIEADADSALLRSDLANQIDPLEGLALSGFSGRTAAAKVGASISPDDKGADKTGVLQSDQAFIDAFSVSKHVKLEPDGVYMINSPIVLKDGMMLDVTGAKIIAGPSFIGNSLIKIDKVSVGLPSWHVYVTGNGRLDCAFKCDWGIEVTYARECEIDVPLIVRGRLGGIIAGTDITEGNSTGINCIGVSVWFHEQYEVQPGFEINNPNSVGIQHVKCSDSYVHRCFSIGYRKGFSAFFSIDYVSCHTWGRRVHGPLITCFEALGDDGSYIGCYADTPHNWKWNGGYGGAQTFIQDATITEVVGWDHLGSTVNLFGNKCILASDPELGATNGIFIPVSFPVAGNTYGTISGLSLAGGTTITQYKMVYRNFDVTATILGYRDRGADKINNASGRGNHIPTAIGTTIEANAIAKTAFHIQAQGNGTTGELLFRRDNENRWIGRLNSQTESGGNAGSNLDFVAYDDNGAFIRDHARFSRSQPRSLFFGRVDADQLFLNNFTLATLPSATTFPGGSGTLMMVSNPAAGKGRLVYSDGTIWRYVSDDSAA